MFISDILSVSGNGTKMAGVSQYSNLTLFIYNGAVVDELHNSFDACTYCDDFYAYAYYKNIACKSWDAVK